MHHSLKNSRRRRRRSRQKKKKLPVKCNPSFTIVAQLPTVFYISRLPDSTRKLVAQNVFLTSSCCCCCCVHRWRCRDETHAIPLTSKQTLKLSEQVFFLSLVPLRLLLRGMGAPTVGPGFEPGVTSSYASGLKKISNASFKYGKGLYLAIPPILKPF